MDCVNAVKSEAVSLSLSLSLSPQVPLLPSLPRMLCLVVLALSSSHLVVAPITKPAREWLCNYCSMGESTPNSHFL